MFRRFFTRRNRPNAKASGSKRLRMESLENREMLSAISVVNGNGSGPGSLYAAIVQANSTVDADTITIDSAVTNINLQQASEALPTIIHPVTIQSSGAAHQVTVNDQNDTIVKGLHINTEADVYLYHVGFTNFNVGLHVEDVGDLMVDGGVFDSNEVVGVQFTESGTPPYVDVGEIWFRDCLIENNDGDGFAFYGYADNLWIDYSTIASNDSNGIVIESSATGLGLDGLLFENTIYSNGEHGIYLNNCRDVSVQSNEIGMDAAGNELENGGSAVRLANGTNDVVLRWNNIHDNDASATTHGIDVTDSTCYSNDLDGNTFWNTDSPIFLQTGSQHGIAPASLSDVGVTYDAGTWTIPISIDLGATFGNTSAEVRAYWFNDEGDIWPVWSTASVALDANGCSSVGATIDVTRPEWVTGCFEIPAGCDSVAMLLTSEATNDTSDFSNTVQLMFGEVDAGCRYVFYDGSYLDNGDDDNAIDSTKSPLLSETQTVTGANVTGYSRGINGIMIDLEGAGDPDAIGIDDFEFATGTEGSWTALASQYVDDITVREGEGSGGSDRIVVTFTDGVIQDTWLRTTLKSNGDTGLTDPDTFYFGNLVGDTNGDRVINSTDLDAVRANWGQSGKLISSGDINLDNIVNSTDLDYARQLGNNLPLPCSGSKSVFLTPRSAAATADAVFADAASDNGRSGRESGVDPAVLQCLAQAGNDWQEYGGRARVRFSQLEECRLSTDLVFAQGVEAEGRPEIKAPERILSNWGLDDQPLRSMLVS